MNRFMTVAIAMMLAINAFAQDVYTKEYNDRKLEKKALKWVKKGKWRNGFTGAAPHESVNIVEFYNQYHKNPEQWNALFKWLANTDLLTIEKGKHPIEGSDLTASVEDSENGPLAKRRSESHRENIDFQYVVKGTERFGIIEHNKYRPDVIHYDYDASKARFYDSTPDKFFVFFPDDWHIAKINNDGNDQTIRVIVVKIKNK